MHFVFIAEVMANVSYVANVAIGGSPLSPIR
jgi:hypothetical protein